ncbi:MAG: ABC transporter permease [Anaerolineales bacterium]
MIRRIFTIALLYLKTTYTSRATFIFTLAMPLLFTFVLGQAMQGLAPDAPPESWPLLVVDNDGTGLSLELLVRVDTNPLVDARLSDRASALAALEEDASSEDGAIAALFIPMGFGETLRAGEPIELIFYQNPEEITRAQILLEAVNAEAAQLAGTFAAMDLSVRVAEQVGLFEGADEGARDAYRGAAFAPAENEWGAGAPVAVTSEAVTRLETGPTIPIGASQSSPGMLVMYALFFTFGGGASLIVERDEGTLRRLLVMPMGKGTILTGKLAGIFIGALVQMAIMVLAGQFAFGVSWGQSAGALVVMLLAYGFAGTALGLMVAALARTAAQANAAGTISIMALASLGGAWWPIEIVPQWMQQLSLVLPTGWAMRGFHDIITRGLDVRAILLEAGVLVGFGLLFLGVGVWRFEYE